MQLPCKIPYRPKWSGIIGCAVFFAGCAVVLAWKATTNDRGLILNGIFRFSPQGATIFYWVLAIASGLFVVAAALLAAQRISVVRFLELTTDEIVIPHGFLQTKISRLPYSEITTLSETSVSGQTFLYLHTSKRKYTVTASLLPAKGEYQKLKEFMTGRLSSAE